MFIQTIQSLFRSLSLSSRSQQLTWPAAGKQGAYRAGRFHFMRPRLLFSGKLLARRVWLALGLSAASTMGLAAVEWLILESLGCAPFSERTWCSILQYSPAHEAGPSLLVYRTYNSDPGEGMRNGMEFSEGRPGRHPRCFHWPDLAPHCAVRLGHAGQLALGSLQGTVYTWDASHPNSRPAPLTTQPGPLVMLAADAAGQTLVVGNGELIAAWNVSSRRRRWSRRDLLSTSMVGNSSPTIVCGTNNGTVVELDLATGTTQRILARHQGFVTCLGLSADGTTLASIGTDCRLLVTDCRTLETLWSRPHSSVAQVCFSPSGDTLVSCGDIQENWRITAWNAASGARLAEMRGHRNAILGMTFGPSNRLYSWSADGTIRTWDIRRARQIDSYSPAAIRG